MPAYSEIKNFKLGDFALEDGSATLKDAFLGYKTIGDVATASKGTNRLAGTAWFAVPLSEHPDTAVLCIAMFGSGESSSPSNTPAPHDGPRFPRVTLRDNVRAQKALLDSLHPGAVVDVVGWSMGAGQCWHWAAMFPDAVQSIVPMCGSAKTSPHNWTFLEGVRLSLLADPKFEGGDYAKAGVYPEDGMRAFGTTYASYVCSQAWYRKQRWTEIGIGSLNSFINDVVVALFRSRDANNLLLQLHSWQTSDVAAGGSVEEALQKIKARCLIMPCDTDMYFPPEDCFTEEAQIGDKSRARCLPIVSEWGHMAGGGYSAADVPWILGKIKAFLFEDADLASL
ncbi:alpha/beta hydrolase fold protein [Hyaloraphidium curvatum]|nr:alpha/beta hydrolase fold protein [Hyaloraphidium curvatum]